MRLPPEWYLQEDVVALARELIGKHLFSENGDGRCGGIIVETEAYRGPEDRGSHAYQNKRTPRNEAMFQNGGIAYVYICYGIHSLFNVVTHREEIPHAILVRAIQPTENPELMLKRRRRNQVDRTLAGGPGSLTKALGISKEHNGLSLQGPEIWIEDREDCKPEIEASPRVGIAYAKEDALLPWRFRWKDSTWTSPAK